MISREPASLILAWGRLDHAHFSISSSSDRRCGFHGGSAGIGKASRGRFNSMGFEFLHWNRTSARENAEALGFGAVRGLAVALLFQALYKGAPFK